MMQYVVGFLFAPERDWVALIKKNRPEWAAGRLNGPGGKVEPGESWEAAMRREFREETGVDLPEMEWEHTVTIQSDKFECRFFRSVSDQAYNVLSMTDEAVSLVWVNSMDRANVVPNLRWLIPLQLEKGIKFPLAPIWED